MKIKKLFAFLMALTVLLSLFMFSASAVECDHSSLEGGVVIKEPTCYSTGSLKVHCDNCGKDFFYEIDMIEHSWEWSYVAYPTVTTTGLKNGKCSVCKKEVKNVEVAKLECSIHSADGWEEQANWEVIYDSTCLQIGKKQAWCTSCSKYVVRDIPIKEHYKTVFPQIDPTCEVAGKTESVYCYNCRTFVTPSHLIASTGHDLYEVADIEEPTCEKEGSGHIYCKNEGCDFEEKVEIAKLNHNDGNSDGFCDGCGARICTCLCHKDNIIAKFIRFLNTLLNNLINNGEMVFRCCECMEPLSNLK